MKRRAGALLLAVMLAMTSIVSYADEEMFTEEPVAEQAVVEETPETAAEPEPEEDTYVEEIPTPEDTYVEETPAPEADTGNEQTFDEGNVQEEDPSEGSIAEYSVNSDSIEEVIEDESETEEETETETETEEVGDPTADVETAADWEATLPKDLTGIWGDDIVKIAQSQLGYTESTKNFVLADSDDSSSASKKKGYTRYGAWYGMPYEDWCAMFASFCLHYAGVPTSAMPEDSGVVSWIQSLKNYGLYADKSTSYQPVSGDLIFFATGSQGADHVGIIESTVSANDENGKSYVTGIYTIEGNSGNAVRENYYDISDSRILGFGVLPGQSGVDEESSSEWEATFPDLTGDTASDVVAIAQSQIGYTESERNFTLLSDWSKNGYTRYGAWYGNSYEDWGAMFVSFCLIYADVSLPASSTAAGLMDAMTEAGIYEGTADYLPSAGDVAFFTSDGKDASSATIIEYVDTEQSDDGEEEVVSLTVIEGDFNNSVREVAYGVDSLIGYGRIKDDEYGIAMLDESDIVASGTSGACTWTLDSDGLLTVSGNGAMKDGNSATSAEWSAYQNDIKTVVIEEGVTNVGGGAFAKCVNLTSVTIPNSVTVIGDQAFLTCSSLATIEIPGSVTSIGYKAFSECKSLTEINIPDSVTEIGTSKNGGYTFESCTNLTSVVLPSGLTQIRTHLFESCTSLTEVNIPDGVTLIDYYAFQKCSSLESIALPDGLVEIGYEAFNGCSKLSSLNGGASSENRLPESLTTINGYAFKDCKSLKQISLPSSITEIPQGTFDGCSALESVTADAIITTLNQYAFRNCSSLTSIFDLSNVSSMGTYVFYNCFSLEEADLSSMESIPNYTFYSCNSLESVVFSESLGTIGNYAFYGCNLQNESNYRETTVSAGAAVISKNDSSVTKTTEEETIYEGYTVEIPDSVTSIGTQAFANTYVEIFNIGNGLSVLDGTAFAGYAVNAVIVANNKNEVTVENMSSIWGNLNKSHSDTDTELVFRGGADYIIYLDGVNGDDDEEGTRDEPVKTFEKAKELAIEKDTKYIYILDTVTISESETWDGSQENQGEIQPDRAEESVSEEDENIIVCRDDSTPSDMIVVDGTGSLTFSNITIDGRYIETDSSQIVVNGGKLTIEDGTKICNYISNQTNDTFGHPTAVSVRGGSLTMNGGEISGNSSVAGAGIALSGGAQMVLTAGTISANSASLDGGGIYMAGNDTTLDMTGGSIVYNTARTNGGGIYVDAGSVATISGGEISYNSQTYDPYYEGFGGGGIYVNSGAGGYENGKLYLYNVEITGNYFERPSQGNGNLFGTISSCDTGNLTLNVTDGAVIHDNDEDYTVMVIRTTTSNGQVVLPTVMLGGGAYNWKGRDGEQLQLDELVYDLSSLYALTDVSTEAGTVTGIERCGVKIVGNSAYVRGSAIGSNGDVYIGKSDGDASIKIEKVWDVSEGTILPDSITVDVYATDGNGVRTAIGSVNLTAENDWKTTISYLPKYDSDGNEYTYDIQEEKITGWEGSVKGGKVLDEDDQAEYEFTLTNTKLVNIYGTKTWNDYDNQDGIRPTEIEVYVLADGERVSDGHGNYIMVRVTPDEDGNWTFQFTDLDPYNADGTEIVYSVEEVEIDGYDTEITVNEVKNSETGEGTGTYTAAVTNNHVPETVDIEGSKTWEDNDDQDAYRPQSITIYLLADGEVIETKTVTESDGWAWSFTDLPKYKEGVEIAYTIIEDAIDYYSTEYNNYNVINTHTPDQTSVSVTKVWDDAGNQDGIRPDDVTVQLYADGNIVEGATLTLDESNNWTGSFIELDIFHDHGERIVYTVAESEEPDGYECTISPVAGSSYSYVMTNKHTPETVEVSGNKTWDDSDNQDGIRPTKITIQLLADGEPVLGENGAAIVATVTEADGWEWSFTGLPKYENGVEIVYTITEDEVDDYTTVVNGFDVTNTHTPGKTGLNVQKIWDDANDQDGVRPESVTVTLLKNGESTEQTLTLDEENGWSGSFTDLDVYTNGVVNEYSIAEVKVEGYTTTVVQVEGTSTINITNTHTPETVDISVTKDWDDNYNQDGARPESITFRLWNGNTMVASATIRPDEDDNWAYTFENLPKYADGEEIAYVVTEDQVSNYTTDVTENEEGGFTVKNTHTPGKTSLSVMKVWDDNNDEDGKRPKEITVTLFADGEKTEQTVTLNEDNSWRGTFTELPEYSEGEKIEYTVVEDDIEDYKSEIIGDATTGYVFVNTHTPETIDIKGSKIWDDSDDQDGIRPAYITIHLFADDEEISSTHITAGEDWNWSFTDLPKYDNGEKIVYTIAEDAVDGYETTIDGYNVTNTHEPETIDIEGFKTWDDSDNQDGERPESISIHLYADGTEIDSAIVTADDDWAWSFADLPKYADGVEITYTIAEDEIGDYVTEVNGYDVTNTHTPGKTGLNVQKIWNDANNQDGVRPDSITVTLLQNGEPTDQRLTLDESNGWSGSFTDLDVYTEGQEGRKNVYSITEDDVEGYECTISDEDDTSTILITNSHTPETVEVSGSKTWDDNDNQDGVRPESITIRLWGDGAIVDTQRVSPDDEGNWSWSFTNLPKYSNGVEIVYNITEDIVPDYSTTYSEEGYDVTNTHTPDKTSLTVLKVWDDNSDEDGDRPEKITVTLFADGEETDQTLSLSEDNGWMGSFTELDRYEDSGKEIEYTVQEETVKDYESSIFGNATIGYVITNTHEPENIDITGEKTWDDANDQDGIRPAYITIHLFADGEEISSTHITAEEDWSWSFTDLPKYEDGEEIAYTITEDEVDGYETTIDGYNVTNTHTSKTINIEGSKTWDDNDNQDGERPEAITVHLHANGSTDDVSSMKVTADDDWAWSFTDLPKYEDGVEIVYTITEDEVDDYTTVVNGYDVTNTHTPGKTGLNVQKFWDDSDNQDGVRPESIIVILTKNGEVTDQSLILNEENGWSGSFTDLDVYTDGKANEYSIAEVEVAEYITTVETVEGTSTINITNAHTPETVSVEGSKTWDDNDNQDGERPDEITIRLWGDGTIVETKTVTADDDWAWSFTDLPKYEDGVEITYNVTEDIVPDYSTTYSEDGYDVTNTHTPDKTSLTVVKVWDDNSDEDGVRPEEITVELLADGEETGKSLILNESNNWVGSFTELDKYEDGGTEIEYTVKELAIENYTSEIMGDATIGYVIVNTHTPETIDIEGSKSWDDADNQDGIRPAYITIHLFADGEEISSTHITAEEDWSWSFTALPKYADGEEIEYAITEDEVSGYDAKFASESDEDGNLTFIVTNIHEPEKVNDDPDDPDVPEGVNPGELPVTKVWDDNDNALKVRPTEIEVQLLANGEPSTDDSGEVVTLTLNEENDWSDSFTDLDKYADGELIEYSVVETETPVYYIAESSVVLGNGSVVLRNELTLNFYPLDEEIVPDSDDELSPDTWVKRESVNEYEAIEIEMSTTLPSIDSRILEAGDFNMTFHNKLDTQLVLDDLEKDFIVDINGEPIDELYYDIDTVQAERAIQPYSITDGCAFHVNVDLSGLYNDGVIDDEDLGTGTVRVFFYADLETTDVNGSYTSTAWYEVLNGEDVLYTSDVSTVAVYTFEIVINKYDTESEAPLAGAIFGLYYDKDCEVAVTRNGEEYTVTSDENGQAMFVGIAEGTYYVKELKAPENYVLIEDPLEIVVEGLEESTHIIEDPFGNTMEVVTEPEPSLTVIKNAVSEPANGAAYVEGEKIEYEITVKNETEMTVTGIEVKDELTGDVWTVDSLEPGANATFTAEYEVTEADVEAGSVVNVATAAGVDENGSEITGDGTDEEPTGEEESTEAETNEPETNESSKAVLTVIKNAVSEPANGAAYVEGEKIEYEITVKNESKQTISDIVVKDELTGDEWVINKLAPGEKEILTAEYTVSEKDVEEGSVVNVATASGVSEDGTTATGDGTEKVQTGTDESEKETEGSGSGASTGTTGSTGSTGSSDSSDESATTSTVKTADDTPVNAYMFLMIMAFCTLIGAGIYRRRRKTAEK